MAIAKPAGYNSYNVHLTETEHQTLINAATLAHVTRAQLLQQIITDNMKLQKACYQFQLDNQQDG